MKLLLKKILSKNKAEFYIECGSGTYIRSLAEDLSKSLGTVGTVSSLRRIGFGDFNKKLISLDYLLSLMHSEKHIKAVKPVNSFFGGVKEINLKKDQVDLILNGRSVKTNGFFKKKNELVFVKFANKIIAFGYILESNFHPKKVFKEI